MKTYIKLLRSMLVLMSRLSPRTASKIALHIFLTPPKTKLSKSEQAFESKCTQEFVDFNNKRIRLLRYGKGDRVCMLVHGWGSRGTHLSRYADALVKSGYTVYVFDGPAHGCSTGTTTDMVEFAQSIAAAAKQLKHVDAIIGHSFGAACTLLSITRYGLNTNQLVLISCFADAIFITESFAHYFRLKPSIIQGMRELLELRHNRTWAWEDIAPALLIRSIYKHILLVHDLNDDEVPFEHAKLLQANNPHVDIFTTQKQGHRKILRNRAGIEAAVSFLTSDIKSA